MLIFSLWEQAEFYKSCHLIGSRSRPNFPKSVSLLMLIYFCLKNNHLSSTLLLACKQVPSEVGKKFGEWSEWESKGHVVTPWAKRTPSSPDPSWLVLLTLDYTWLSRPKPNREPFHRLPFYSIFEIYLQIIGCWFVLSLINSTMLRIRLFGVFRKTSCKEMISDDKNELYYHTRSQRRRCYGMANALPLSALRYQDSFPV